MFHSSDDSQAIARVRRDAECGSRSGVQHHVRKLFPTSVDQAGPVLVHCSAGIGRSGTFITLDMMTQQMKDKATLGFCQCVRYLQIQKVKNKAYIHFSFLTMKMGLHVHMCGFIYVVSILFQAQYEFIHHALSELVVCGQTEMTASSLRAFIDSHDP